MATIPKGNVFTGARARFTYNGQTIGYATNCSGSEEIQYEAVEILDNIQVVEHVPVGYRVTFSAGRLRLVDFSVKSTSNMGGMFPKTGADPSDHLRNILAIGDDVSVTITDTITGKTIMLLEQVKLQSYNFSVSARGLTAEDLTFVAVRMRDEAEENT